MNLFGWHDAGGWEIDAGRSGFATQVRNRAAVSRESLGRKSQVGNRSAPIRVAKRRQEPTPL